MTPDEMHDAALHPNDDILRSFEVHTIDASYMVLQCKLCDKDRLAFCFTHDDLGGLVYLARLHWLEYHAERPAT